MFGKSLLNSPHEHIFIFIFIVVCVLTCRRFLFTFKSLRRISTSRPNLAILRSNVAYPDSQIGRVLGRYQITLT